MKYGVTSSDFMIEMNKIISRSFLFSSQYKFNFLLSVQIFFTGTDKFKTTQKSLHYKQKNKGIYDFNYVKIQKNGVKLVLKDKVI
ncbi:hypothetical protein BA195_11705 [Tenacibaculum soleae]|uniref:Uncharacterized protein n=1 Tax=Tenacibaculum soleae TaxID=447689 RepID=A0A1B9XXK1_9FLAO|nr:hypothetical protein BA195_11705 [Tenacibaculum soleae]